ncbi:MAG: hypothetical protein IKN55_10695 [Oscillospiraceae bacterium]|nr:hypothetical protein [Oscillospiraceae bacterium]
MHRNSLLGASPAASFLYNLTKNLAAHLHHQLCAVLPIKRKSSYNALDFETILCYNRCNKPIKTKEAWA